MSTSGNNRRELGMFMLSTLRRSDFITIAIVGIAIALCIILGGRAALVCVGVFAFVLLVFSLLDKRLIAMLLKTGNETLEEWVQQSQFANELMGIATEINVELYDHDPRKAEEIRLRLGEAIVKHNPEWAAQHQAEVERQAGLN